MTTSSATTSTSPVPTPAQPTGKPAAAAVAPAATAKVQKTAAPESKEPKAVAKAPAKPAKRPAAPAKKATPAAEPALPAKEIRTKKVKLVRDSFTIPKDEYAIIEALKQRAGSLAQPVKKSELLRAGLKVLAGLSDAALRTALQAVPSIKTGRPKAETTATKPPSKSTRK